MPSFGDDHGREVSLSSAWWHHASNHNAALRLHHRLQDEARASGFDVHQVETSVVYVHVIPGFPLYAGSAATCYHRHTDTQRDILLPGSTQSVPIILLLLLTLQQSYTVSQDFIQLVHL